jgi:hypothetical protein
LATSPDIRASLLSVELSMVRREASRMVQGRSSPSIQNRSVSNKEEEEEEEDELAPMMPDTPMKTDGAATER